MPFLLAEILNFQGSTHRIGVGSFSKLSSTVLNIGKQNVLTFSSVSIKTHVDTVIKEFTLTSGIWLVAYNIQFPDNNIGYRQSYIDSSNVAADIREANDSTSSGAGMTILSGTTVFNHTESTTYKLHAIQNSGSTLKVNGYINAVRIK